MVTVNVPVEVFGFGQERTVQRPKCPGCGHAIVVTRRPMCDTDLWSSPHSNYVSCRCRTTIFVIGEDPKLVTVVVDQEAEGDIGSDSP